MSAIRGVKIWSDNFDGQLLTIDAYKEVTLQMSSSDFDTHKILPCIGEPSFIKSPIDLIDL